jgi:hypothetical protein
MTKTAYPVHFLLLATLAFAGACSDDAENEQNNQPDSDAGSDVTVEAQAEAQSEAQADVALEACPDEVDLTTATLPCDCYGHVATDPAAQVPGCESRVVCSASLGDLRCEDEQDAAQDAAPDATEDAPEEASVKACPIEKDLSTVTLPCDCYGTLVEDTATAMPECELKVVCCPGKKGLVCE